MQKEDIKSILVFDVWSDYAHFRKGYTTTSPLTFSIPPRTAICGLIGAIAGLEKENNDYLRYFTLEDTGIGLKILNPIKKVRIAENLINTKDNYFLPVKKGKHNPRTQIRFEFIKDPKYRIYFYHNDSKFYRTIKMQLSEHKSVYTPCLGLSENIANFRFIGELYTSVQGSNNGVPIHSVIPAQLIDHGSMKFTYGSEYFSERISTEMDTERIVTRYSDIIFERNGNPIKVKIKESYMELNYDNGTKENVVFIE